MKAPIQTYDPEELRDVSEAVYRARLEQDSTGNVASMIEKDGDGGKKLRGRAAQYDSLTRIYLDALSSRPMPRRR